MDDRQQDRIIGIAEKLEEYGAVRIDLEWTSDPRVIARETATLRAAADLLGVPVEIENVSGYFVRARVVA